MNFPIVPFLKLLFVTDSKDWAHWRLHAPPTPVVPDKNYFEVRIDSMRLRHSRVGFKKFHAAVHSFFTYTHTESGRYTAADWLRTYSEHLEEHIDQINRTVEAWRSR